MAEGHILYNIHFGGVPSIPNVNYQEKRKKEKERKENDTVSCSGSPAAHPQEKRTPYPEASFCYPPSQ